MLLPSVTDTVGNATTVRFTDLLPEPALLVHVIVYVLVPAEDILPVLVLPLAPGEVTQLEVVPLAAHEVGLFVALQLMVDELPVLIEVGEAEIVTTGGCAAGPPDPTLSVV